MERPRTLFKKKLTPRKEIPMIPTTRPPPAMTPKYSEAPPAAPMSAAEENPRKRKPPVPLSSSSTIARRFRAKLHEEMERRRRRMKREDSAEIPLPPATAEEVVRLYEESLTELTHNSKAAINDLSRVADEQKEHAEGIANAICERILRVPKEQKLPVLHLLDCIVHNVEKPYKEYFEARLYRVFCKAYNQADSSLHKGMRHLFETWTSQACFSSSVISKIGNELDLYIIEGKKPSHSLDANLSNTQSPCSHDLHVNPKGASYQSEHSAVDAQHATVPSGLLSYGKKSSVQCGDYDLDHRELLRTERGIEAVRTTGGPFILEVEVPLHRKNSLPRPSSSYRTELRRSVSPTGNQMWVDTYPRGDSDTSSSLHSGRGYESDRMSYRNCGVAPNWSLDDSSKNHEASSVCNLINRRDDSHARYLVSAYGGQDNSHENSPKAQVFVLNGLDTSRETRNLDSFEEKEKFVCEDMSPTVPVQSRWCATGLSGRSGTLLGNNFNQNNCPRQTPLPQADKPASVVEDTIPGFGYRLNSEHQGHIGCPKEPLQFGSPPACSQDALRLEFSSKLLKFRRKAPLNALNGDLPTQCTTCGMCFKSQEVLRSHMDRHLIQN